LEEPLTSRLRRSEVRNGTFLRTTGLAWAGLDVWFGNRSVRPAGRNLCRRSLNL